MIAFLDAHKMIQQNKILGPLPDNKKIYRHAFEIAWPSALESIFLGLISAVDTMMVGSLGTSAIAAVGICTQPKFIVMATLIGLNTGVNVVIARRKGENRQDQANQTLRNALILSFFLSLLFVSIGFIFAKPALLFAGASHEYLDLSVVYFRYIMIGTFFHLLALTMTAAQRGAGKTKISMTCNLSANIVNVIMNAILINGLFFFPKLGVQGAAIATMIGNIVAFLLAILSLLKNNQYLHISLTDNWSLDKETLKAIFKISVPSLCEQIFLRIGFFTYSKAVANLGTTDYATHLICINVMTISFGLGDGLSVASSTLVGQSLGAKRSDMAIIYGKVLQRIGFVMSMLLGICIALFNDQIMHLFTNDPIVIKKGAIVLLMIALVIQFQVSQVITMGCLRGAGDAKFVAFISLITITIIRPLGTYALAYGVGLGLIGAWLSIYLDQFTRLIASKQRFNKAQWIKIKV